MRMVIYSNKALENKGYKEICISDLVSKEIEDYIEEVSEFGHVYKNPEGKIYFSSCEIDMEFKNVNEFKTYWQEEMKLV